MSKKGIFALAIGIAAGAATGVLFSPTSGKKFRDKLKKEVQKGGFGKDSIYSHFKGLAEEIKHAAEEGIEKAGLDEKAAKIVRKVKSAKNKLVKKAATVEKQVEQKVKSTAKKALKNKSVASVVKKAKKVQKAVTSKAKPATPSKSTKAAKKPSASKSTTKKATKKKA